MARRDLITIMGIPVEAPRPDMSGKYGVAGVGVPAPLPGQIVKRVTPGDSVSAPPRISYELPGVGGPATAAQVAATNAAAAAAAKLAAPPARVTKKSTTTKKKPAGSGDGTKVAPPPVVTGDPAAVSNDGTYDWFHPASYWEDQARTGLQGDIDASRASSDRGMAALKAQQEGASRLLSDFGKSVSQYYANAATRAGQDYDTRAAVQALLGAVGQRAFTGQGAGSIASDLAATGNGALGRALASQETNRNTAIGAILNRIVGTDKADEYMTAARNATNAGLSNATAQSSYGKRLLAGLLSQQQTAMNELLGKRSDFEAKVPGIISTRAQELSNQAAKNMLAAQAFGLKVKSQQDLQAYRDRTLDIAERKIDAAAKKASSLTPAQDLELRREAGIAAKALADGVKTTTYDANGNAKSQSVSSAPVENYQQALKQLAAKAPGLPIEYYLTLLNQYPKWSVPGQNGRPYLDVITRGVLVSKGYDPDEVYAAAFDPAQYARFKPVIESLR